MKKAILSVIFLFFTTSNSSQTKVSFDVQEFKEMQLFDHPQYDEFDSMTDLLIEKGIEPEKPKELSKTVIILRRVGGAIFSKYIAAKQWIMTVWRKIFSKSVVHAKKCPTLKNRVHQ